MLGKSQRFQRCCCFNFFSFVTWTSHKENWPPPLEDEGSWTEKPSQPQAVPVISTEMSDMNKNIVDPPVLAEPSWLQQGKWAQPRLQNCEQVNSYCFKLLFCGLLCSASNRFTPREQQLCLWSLLRPHLWLAATIQKKTICRASCFHDLPDQKEGAYNCG